MNPTDFIKDLETAVYCRIGVSKIHGVGVIAIRPIPKGIDPMEEARDMTFNQVSSSEVFDNANITPEVKELVKAMCPENDGVLDIPPCSLNEIGVSFYLNHSKNPNMECDDEGNFFALRDISPGEELTVDYGTYGALNLE
jgi:hypothetical protein